MKQLPCIIAIRIRRLNCLGGVFFRPASDLCGICLGIASAVILAGCGKPELRRQAIVTAVQQRIADQLDTISNDWQQHAAAAVARMEQEFQETLDQVALRLQRATEAIEGHVVKVDDETRRVGLLRQDLRDVLQQLTQGLTQEDEELGRRISLAKRVLTDVRRQTRVLQVILEKSCAEAMRTEDQP